jgi:hypothetical protein
VATGAPREEKLLAFCEQAGAILAQQLLISCSLTGTPRVSGDSPSETEEGGREEHRCGPAVHGVFYPG